MTEYSDDAERRHSKVGPAKLWKMKRDFQIAFLKRVGLQPHHFLLDLGCGTLRGGIPIIAFLQERHYTGMEVRNEILSEAEVELQDAGLMDKRPELILIKDTPTLPPESAFDFVWAFSVLIHMNDSTLRETLNFVRKHLGAGGRFYANVHIDERPDTKWNNFPCVYRSFEFYSEAALSNGLAIEELGALTDLGHVMPNQTLGEQAHQRMLRFTIAR